MPAQSLGNTVYWNKTMTSDIKHGQIVETIVDTANGKLRGEQVGGIHRFRGVPYGQSSGGANRFLRARPVDPWRGVREAAGYGPRAPQPEEPSSGLAWRGWIRDRSGMGEDCLVLNIWTPGLDAGKRPVMFYIHGGGFNTGSGGAAGCDGEVMARRGDAVVVTLNHRLNLFGHLYFERADERHADAGNNGVLDIVAALQWVRTNIHAFGGDAGNVTIFGQSGGGSKVAVLMAMAEAKGLFHKAVVQSASSLIRMATPEEAARCTHALMNELGMAGRGPTALQDVPAATLLAARKRAVATAGDNFRPVVDGGSLVLHPFDPSAPAASADVPLLIGTCATELTFALGVNSGNFTLSEDEARQRVSKFVGVDGAQAATLMRRFRASRPSASPSDVMIAVMSEHMYRRNDILAAERKAAAGGAPAYMYLFTWKTQAVEGMLKTPHTMCIPFVFGTVDAAAEMLGNGPERHILSDRVMNAWLAFARTGRPGHPGLPSWQPYSAGERATMIFDNECRQEADPLSADRLAMEDVPPYTADASTRRNG
jgi:para-nitrobenzyl esterase